jgi:hypothetical protein
MKATRIVVFVLFALVSAVQPGRAQTPQNADFPVIFEIAGGLESWHEGDAAPRPVESCAAELVMGLPVVSPSGEWLAYNTIPTAGDSVFAQNVWLCNLSTGEAVQVAQQALTGSSEPQKVFHSLPSWSPDGTQFAWTEAIADSTHRLVVYDLATRTAHVLASDLPPTHLYSLASWGNPGILVADNDQLTLFAPDGTLIRTLPNLYPYARYCWVTHDSGADYIGSWSPDDEEILLLDPVTGDPYYADGGVELYSTLASDPVLAIRFRLAETGVYEWIINTPDGTLIPTGILLTYPPIYSNFLALSPEGDAAIFITAGEARLWRDGELQTIPGTEGRLTEGKVVRWAPIAYRAWGDLISAAG